MIHTQPLFRPPSEWDSFILQITEGCSWNRCHFCEMYKRKAFRIKEFDELEKELQRESRGGRLEAIRRVFLADGNATVLPANRLGDILSLLKRMMPNLRRVSCYVSPRDLTEKSDGDLAALRSLGLSRLYCGIESGDPLVLARNNKGESPESTLFQLQKAKKAKMDLSVMILLGLGGMEQSAAHAQNSAALLNTLQPYQLSLLVLGYPFGLDHYLSRLSAPFTPLTLGQLFEEMRLLVKELQLERSHFRCDHASNFLPLKGVLSRDKKAILAMIDHFSRLVPPSRKPFLPRIG